MARRRSVALTMPHFSTILRKEEDAEDLIQSLTKGTVRGLRSAVREFSVRSLVVIRDLLDGRGEPAKGQDAIDLGMLIADALLDSGLEDVAKDFRKDFKKVEEAGLEYFDVFASEMAKPGFDVTDIRAFATVQEQAFLDLADQRLVQPMRDAVLNGILGNRDSDTIMADVRRIMDERGILTRDRIGFTDTQLETLVEDSYRRYYRVTKMTQANELGMEVIWFQGPDDDLTSDQCRFLLTKAPHGVPNMWLKEEFTTELHPALKQDPLVAGGHWNCRHTVNPVTLGFAESMGFRAPGSVPDDDEVAENAEEL